MLHIGYLAAFTFKKFNAYYFVLFRAWRSRCYIAQTAETTRRPIPPDPKGLPQGALRCWGSPFVEPRKNQLVC